METGYLTINVYADNIAQPVNDAEIKIIGENTDFYVKTDSNGKTEKISLYAPRKEYSLTPQKDIRPYSKYTIIVKKDNLQTTIIEGVEIFAGEEAIQDVYLSSDVTDEISEKIIKISEHTLWGDYPPKIIEDELEELDTRALPFVIIPEYVIVHAGVPTNTSAANYTVLFTDYIKNVASGEIYSTWPRETLKANILAIISFTQNRIFTEWYRSKGFHFTITSSTAYDQYFSYGRTIYQSISDVVDEVFNQYLKLPNVIHPFFAQYNDGIKTNNKGWLSQWGSKELGERGYSAIEILRHYYSNAIYISTAEEIEGLPLSFPGYNLVLGSCGEAIQKIQNEINVITGNYPGIPKISPANGKYENNTYNSVIKFQEVFGLPKTGIVDFSTWYKISYIYVAVSNMLKGIYG